MSKATEKVAEKRNMEKKKIRNLLISICVMITVILLISYMYIQYFHRGILLSSQNPQIALLKDHILKNDNIEKKIKADLLNSSLKKDFFIVFLSICNTQDRALVVKGTGTTLNSAWDSVDKKAADIVKKENYNVIWAKADIVNSSEEILTVDLNKEVAETYYGYFYRKGIAFDENFDIAFLEAEVNGNKIISYYTESQVANNQIDYDSIILNPTNINYYMKTYYGYDEQINIPNKITTFSTLGFFCDKNNIVYELYDKGLDYGRRIDTADDKVIESAIISASMYLYDLIMPNGEFIYGYYPIFDNKMTSYNILRHASSIWSLINLYRITSDEQLVFKLNAAIDYLIDGYIEYKKDDVAYVIERKADEIKLGGNAVTIIMLTEYMEVFKTDEYRNLVSHLANGILEMENLDEGTFYHVLNYPDYSRKEEYRTVYYDGEATFALTRAYTFTGDEKYLNGAMMAVENFIAKDYTKYRDHWVAYALNEIIKYVTDIRYYEFALKNIGNNLDRIYNQKTSYHTYLELLMTGWQTYMHIIENTANNPDSIEYLNEFDVEYFAQTIYKRARHMLNGYFYPEYAMYMKKPEKIVGTFFVRHDNFRVRIDDIQHFIGGYYFYTKYYNDILPYLSDSFLTEINQSGIG